MAEKLVQLLIVTDGKLKVTRDDAGFLVVTSSIASKFQNLSCKILENRREIDYNALINE